MYYGWLFTQDIEDRVGVIAARFGIQWSGCDDEDEDESESEDDEFEYIPTGPFTEDENKYLEKARRTMSLVLYEIEDRLAEQSKTSLEALELCLEFVKVITPGCRENWTYLISVSTNYHVLETSYHLVQRVQELLGIEEDPKWYAASIWMSQLRLDARLR